MTRGYALGGSSRSATRQIHRALPTATATGATWSTFSVSTTAASLTAPTQPSSRVSPETAARPSATRADQAEKASAVVVTPPRTPGRTVKDACMFSTLIDCSGLNSAPHGRMSSVVCASVTRVIG